jgi:transposase
MVKQSIAKLDRFGALNEGEQIWVGVDVHKRDYHVALMSGSGLSETFVCSAKPEVFLGHLARLGLKVALVAYEAGPTGHHLARVLEEYGLPVYEVAPSKLLRPVRPGAKTDRLDCLKLAEYGAKGMLRPIAVPSLEEEADRSLIRHRHQLVDSLRQVKQRIRSMLLN